MLTFEQLKKQYTDMHIPIYPKNMLVEYVQHEILDSLFREEESQFLSFLGGTAIRIGYAGNRFSEDLDFDNFGLSFESFKDLLCKVEKHMTLKGFEIEFRLVEKGAFHCYFKFPRLLKENNLSSYENEKILVRIDTVKKEKTYIPSLYTLHHFGIYRDILITPANIILAQKLVTIIERKREKGRDFYDISFLFGMTEPDFEYMETTYHLSKEILVQQVQERCKTLDFSQLAKDVEPFLIYPDQKSRVLYFQKFITDKL